MLQEFMKGDIFYIRLMFNTVKSVYDKLFILI